MTQPDCLEARAAAVSAVTAAADMISAQLESGDWTVRTKEDGSPVTDLDVAVEKAIHSMLSEAMPGVAFFGEETGRSAAPQAGEHAAASASGGVEDGVTALWLVDPIDGTKSFIRGMPYYSTQIALMIDGELVVGVSNAPAYRERLVAVKGDSVTLNRKPVTTSEVTRIDQAFLSTGNLTSLASDPARWLAFGKIVSTVRRARGYGDFCHYHQLCRGQTDLVIESDLNILDIAALTVGVREAGGVITDMQGAPIDLHTTSVLAAGTEALHAAALEALQAR